MPKQARSNDLVAAILEAAVQVLARDGARRFTTTRVAERAGVSVGSVYQYFPNKASILFRLQADEWRRTSEMLAGILGDHRKPPFVRLRALVRAFIRSECDEAEIRTALHDAAPWYRDAPGAEDAKAAGDHAIAAFVREVMPRASPAKRALAASLVTTTLGAVGQEFSSSPRTSHEIARFSDALATMLCAYLGERPRVAGSR